MTDAPPVDQHERDRIRTDHHATLFVEAGAGTGKTTALIARLVELAGAGVPLSSVAAITFTEAAAAELRDRLRFELDQRLADEPDNPAWARALDELDGAAIQTLHGFAQRLLALYPLEAGLPPGFTVRDEPAARAAFDERFEQFLDEFLGEEGPVELVEMLEGFGCLARVKDIALALHGSWDRLSRPADPLVEPPRPRADELASMLRDLISIEPRKKHPDKFEEVIQVAKAMLAALEASGAGPSHFEYAQVLTQELKPGKGNRNNWETGALAAAKASGKAAEEVRVEWAAEYGRYMSEHVLAHLSSFVLDCAEERRRDGTLEFHDLLVFARDLLADPANGPVRAALHQRFTHILIDEFQDTDPLQVELATRIARDPETPAATPWHASEVPPGSVFVVGDPRQSIYRFRRADIALYSSAREALAAEPVWLSQNFRSRRGIIEWVNEAFSRLLEDEADPAAPVPYIPLRNARNDTSPAPVLHLGDRVEGSAHVWRRQQGEDIARTITWIREHGHAHGLVRDDGEPLRHSDIAILFRTRTGVASLEQALEEAGIPYRVESRSLIYQTQEIADLANILATLADPTNEVAITAALRSPAFACTDRDLLEFRRSGGRWSYTAEPAVGLDPDHPVVAGLRWLADAHERAVSLSVNEVVEMVVRERHMMELAYAFRRPREHWQRYRYVLDQARAFAAEPGASLRRFVAWLRHQQDEGVSVLESAAPQTDDDAVRLMTVHASKGLEFPAVIMTGLGTAPKNSTPPVVWDADGGVHLRLRANPPVACDAYGDASSSEKRAAAAEEARILYVAATRARELLVLALHRNADTSNAGKLATFAVNLPPVPLDEVAASPRGSAGDHTPPPDATWLEERDRWIARRRERIADRAHGNAVAATRVARGVASAGEERDYEAADQPPWKRGRAGTSLGRAVHAALQVVDFDDAAALTEIARAQAIAEGIAGREHEVEEIVGEVLASTAVREARAARHWREIFVSTPLEGHLLEGFIDLLYEHDGGLVVVDYKTDALRTDAEIDDAVERYRFQLAAYALALSVQLGRPIAGCRFVFANEHRTAERALDDTPAAMDRVREALRDWPSTPS